VFTLNWGNVVRQNCLAQPPHIIGMVEDESGSAIPAGDAVPTADVWKGEARFPLDEWYTPAQISQIVECTTRYYSYQEYLGATTGNCAEGEVCPEPDQIIIGASNPYPTPVDVRLIGVELDVKPCSTPSAIGLSGAGVVPVAVVGSETFNVDTVDLSDLSSMRLSTDPEFSEWANPIDLSIGYTYCSDGTSDLIMHFTSADLISIGVNQETTKLYIQGDTDAGVIIGHDDSIKVLN